MEHVKLLDIYLRNHPSSRPHFPRFFDLPAGRRGAGALVSGIGNLVLSNIWRNEYYLADLGMPDYPYLPKEYFF
jgi:hypothetical protein